MEAILDMFCYAWSKKLLCIFSSSVTNFSVIRGSVHLKTNTVGSVFLCLRGQGKDFLPIRWGKKSRTPRLAHYPASQWDQLPQHA